MALQKLLEGKFNMSLTGEQELEMYANVKVIMNNCLACKQVQNNHEKRLATLEKGYWVFVGVSSVITFILPFILHHFLKG